MAGQNYVANTAQIVWPPSQPRPKTLGYWLDQALGGDTLDLGTMATQDADAVAITGGTITGMPTPSAPTDVVIKSYADAINTALEAEISALEDIVDGLGGGGSTITGGATVASIADLRALDATFAAVNLDIIYVLSWVANAETGGGTFQYRASLSEADDSGTIIVDAAGRRWRRVEYGILDITMFGAVHDGATDNATALAAVTAHAYALWEAGSLASYTAQPGVYHTSEIWELTAEGMTVYGPGAVFDNTIWVAVENVKLYGLTVTGAPGNGFVLHRGQGGFMANCWANECEGFGFLHGGGYRSQVAWSMYLNLTSIQNAGGWGVSLHGGTEQATPVTGSIVCLEPAMLGLKDQASNPYNYPWSMGSITAAGSGYTPDGTYFVMSNNATNYISGGTTDGAMTGGDGAIFRLVISGGAVTSAKIIHGGKGYTTGEVINFTRANALDIDRNGLSAGSGFQFTVGTVSVGSSATQEKAWLNATQFLGFNIRSNSVFAIEFSNNGNINYNNFENFQVEANGNVAGAATIMDRPLWNGVCNNANIKGAHFADNGGLEDGVRLIEFYPGSARNSIEKGRYIHAAYTGDTKIEDLIYIGDYARIDTVAQGDGIQPSYYYGPTTFATGFHTGGRSATVGTDGTNTAPSTTKTYLCEVQVTANTVVTGINILAGNAAAGSWRVLLYDALGTFMETSATTAQASTNAYVQLPFTTAPIGIVAGTYLIGVQMNNVASRFRSHTFGSFVAGSVNNGGFADLSDVTTPTGFTASEGPIASLY